MSTYKFPFFCPQCQHEQALAGPCEICELRGMKIEVKSAEEIEAEYSKEMNFSSPMDASYDDYFPNGDSQAAWKSWFDNYSANSLTTTTSATTTQQWTYKPKEKPRRAREWRDHNIWFIGDIHGNVAEYQSLLKQIREDDPNCITIQVGDIELGRCKLPPQNPRDFFIQGNHDDIGACMKHPNFLGKFGYKHGVFFMGGAASKGLGYKNEELSDAELSAAVKLFNDVKPEIVVSHDCPQSFCEEFMWKKEKSRTREALDEMWQIHNPHVWAFGHHHTTKDEVFDGCQFMCVYPCDAQQIRLAWSLGAAKYEKPSQPVEQTASKVISSVINKLNPFG